MFYNKSMFSQISSRDSCSHNHMRQLTSYTLTYPLQVWKLHRRLKIQKGILCCNLAWHAIAKTAPSIPLCIFKRRGWGGWPYFAAAEIRSPEVRSLEFCCLVIVVARNVNIVKNTRRPGVSIFGSPTRFIWGLIFSINIYVVQRSMGARGKLRLVQGMTLNRKNCILNIRAVMVFSLF